MDYYKIFKEGFELVNLYDSIEAAQAVADTLPNQPYNVEFYAPYTPMSAAEKTALNLAFGAELIHVFVTDNAEMNPTQEQSDALLIKFQNILSFAQVGGITSINNHLPSIPTDEIYTEERKAKYLQMIADYLAQFD